LPGIRFVRRGKRQGEKVGGRTKACNAAFFSSLSRLKPANSCECTGNFSANCRFQNIRGEIPAFFQLFFPNKWFLWIKNVVLHFFILAIHDYQYHIGKRKRNDCIWIVPAERGMASVRSDQGTPSRKSKRRLRDVSQDVSFILRILRRFRQHVLPRYIPVAMDRFRAKYLRN